MTYGNEYIPLTANDREAERLLSLAILFQNATRPLGTSLLRATIYHSCKSDEAARKAFQRDREKLVLCGLVIKQDAHQGDEHTWTIDSSKTFPNVADGITHEQATALNVACAPLFNDPAFPYANDLRNALLKLDRTFDANPPVAADPRTRNVSVVRRTLELCAVEGHPALICYTKADGSTSKRTIGICGFFELNGSTYVVAQRTDVPGNEGPHRYNLERVVSAKPLARTRFEVPPDFDIRDYILLPFQVGQPQYTATFRIPPQEYDNLSLAAMGKGVISSPDSMDNHTWEVQVSDTRRAAAWAIAHAIVPQAPEVLVLQWRHTLEEAARHDE